DSATNIAANAGGYISGTVNVTFFQSIPTIAQIAAADALTNGVVSFGGILDTPANLVANIGGYLTGNVAFTTNGNATIAQITAIDNHTTVAAGVGMAYTIGDTYANLLADNGTYRDGAGYIFVSDPVTVAEAQA